jgi:hypothetical protein
MDTDNGGTRRSDGHYNIVLDSVTVFGELEDRLKALTGLAKQEGLVGALQPRIHTHAFILKFADLFCIYMCVCTAVSLPYPLKVKRLLPVNLCFEQSCRVPFGSQTGLLQ